MAERVLRVGTRASALARTQAAWVAARLEERFPGLRCQLVPLTTRGDRDRSRPLYALEGTGAFVKELEQALLAGEIDLAVHSAKDVPTRLPDGLELAAFPQRESPADALVLPAGGPGAGHGGPVALRAAQPAGAAPGGEEPGAAGWARWLPPGARVGTSSLRRQALLRARRPDLRVEPVRGNLDTRLRRLDQGEFDALVLAAAGLRRLGLGERITWELPVDELPPAPGQGALAVEVRAGDRPVRDLVAALDRPEVARAVRAERAFLAELGGTCRVPLGALARVEGESLVMIGLVAGLEGEPWLREALRGPATAPEDLGRRLAARLLERGAGEILEAAARTAGSVPAPGQGPAGR